MSKYFDHKIKAVNYSAFHSIVCGMVNIEIDTNGECFSICLTRNNGNSDISMSCYVGWVEASQMSFPDSYIERILDVMIKDLMRIDDEN